MAARIAAMLVWIGDMPAQEQINSMAQRWAETSVEDSALASSSASDSDSEPAAGEFDVS